MIVGRLAFLAAGLASVAACGNHNHAPVVYGTQGGHTARIYDSPDEIARKQQIARARQAEARAAAARPAPTQAVVSQNIEPVALTPVSAIYLDDDERAAAAAPAKQSARGYIEVQPGDTVYGVSRKFNVTPEAVIAANNLRAPYTLSVGQALKLPRGAALDVANEPVRGVVARDTLYTVKTGDTLYAISRASRVPVQNIASANRLSAPYTLSIGQQIVIPQTPAGELYVPAQRTASAEPQQRTVAAATRKPSDAVAEVARSVSYTPPAQTKPGAMFEWPLRGAIVSEFGSGDLGRRNDGVNIAAPAGTVVRAAADGEVVYRGSELEGFGNLLLVKHQDGFVTAYAHNDAMLVKKGQTVRQGQVIAKVGQTGSVSTPQLHFEIRQNLKSVDPVGLLGRP